MPWIMTMVSDIASPPVKGGPTVCRQRFPRTIRLPVQVSRFRVPAAPLLSELSRHGSLPVLSFLIHFHQPFNPFLCFGFSPFARPRLRPPGTMVAVVGIEDRPRRR